MFIGIIAVMIVIMVLILLSAAVELAYINKLEKSLAEHFEILDRRSGTVSDAFGHLASTPGTAPAKRNGTCKPIHLTSEHEAEVEERLGRE
jgi:hypothetical protein